MFLALLNAFNVSLCNVIFLFWASSRFVIGKSTVEEFDINLLLLYSHMPYQNDTIIEMQEDFFNKIFTSHFIARVRKGLLKVCVWEGAGDRTELKYFDPHSYGRQLCVYLVLLMLNRRPWGPLCWVLAFFTASYQQLLWSPNSIGAPDGPLCRVWLSLLHLVYNFWIASILSRRGETLVSNNWSQFTPETFQHFCGSCITHVRLQPYHS